MNVYRRSNFLTVMAVSIQLFLVITLYTTSISFKNTNSLLSFGLIILITILTLDVIGGMQKKIILESKSVVLKIGILGTTTIDVRYSKINSIKISKNILGSIFNYGTIIIYTGNDIGGIRFEGLSNPEQVKRKIDKMIDKTE